MATTQDPQEYAHELTRRFKDDMKEQVDSYINEDFFEAVGGREALVRKIFPDLAWQEYYIGSIPTARQLDLVYRMGDPYYRDRDIITGLAKQIRDEIKHAKIFANFSEQFGEPVDLASWEPPYYEANVQKCRAATEHEKPHYVAAGFQCSTEILATFWIRNMADYLEAEYPNMANTMRDVASDEGDHVHVGRKTIKRFAEPDDIEEMERISKMKRDAVLNQMKEMTNIDGEN